MTDFLLAHPIAAIAFLIIAGAILVLEKCNFLFARLRDVWRWLSNHAGPR